MSWRSFFISKKEVKTYGFQRIENAQEIRPADFRTMAAVMFYPDFMDQVAKELGGDIFILPSSVHEVLILPDDGNMNAQELKEMVTSINASEVAPEDRLTDNVYHYDA